MRVIICIDDDTPTECYVLLAAIPRAGEFVATRQFSQPLLVQKVVHVADPRDELVCTLYCTRME